MNYRVIKEGDLFLITDPSGNILENDDQVRGLFTQDTRFLSVYEVSVKNIEMSLLASNAAENYIGTIRLANKKQRINNRTVVTRESISMDRKRFIANDVLYETVAFRNYNPFPVELHVEISAGADYKDLYELRGYQYGQRGSNHPIEVSDGQLRFSYTGSDHVNRATTITFSPLPKTVSCEGKAGYQLTLEPFGVFEFNLVIQPEVDSIPERMERTEAIRYLEESYQQWNADCTEIETDDETFNALVQRSMKDIRVLLTDIGHGRFPVAGLPIFAIPFGRDSLIAALQLLAINPELAKGTLKTMAAHQGTKVDPSRDEQPGKILHMIRSGELVKMGLLPFDPFFGTIDATPLFLVLAAEYYHWTGDEKFIFELLPSIEKALKWIDEYGDRDGDGYVEYIREASYGPSNQGWKDSDNSNIHKDGSLAKVPIVLAEVQGYVYDAKIRMAALFERLNHPDKARELQVSAEKLKQNFARDFWMEEENYVAIALDQDKKQVESVTSNPGHCLWSGLLTENQAKSVADRLLETDLFSGWGIRTMSSKSTGYNPMSYHNGSVWPHDNSICALGLMKYGYQNHANRVIESLIDSSKHFDYDRMPELFCGYSREEGTPVPYPVACSPQAWAAGTPLLFIRTMLGLVPNVPEGIVQISPSLPNRMKRMIVKNLKVGNGTLDLLVIQCESHSTLKVLHNSTGLQVEIV